MWFGLPLAIWPLAFGLQLCIGARLKNPGFVLTVVGGAMNWLVILMNGSHMPVVGMPASDAHGEWVPASGVHNLLFLADRWSWPSGSSPGDVVLLTGAVICLLWPIARGRLSESGGER